jgi:peptidoglycan hydrolase-like protein with peptidoglycan-binding domain
MAASVLGSRLLYLHDPYFMGDDVLTLQTALATLGFVCPVDGAFDIGTERAVKDFQQNVLLEPDGIAGPKTSEAINLLGHAWQGKEARSISTADLSKAKQTAKGQEVVCVYGTDDLARSVAERLANRAQVATPAQRIVSPVSLEAEPPATAFMLELTYNPKRIAQLQTAQQRVLQFTPGAAFNTAFNTLWTELQAAPERRAAITLDTSDTSELSQQHIAVTILDAIQQSIEVTNKGS